MSRSASAMSSLLVFGLLLLSSSSCAAAKQIEAAATANPDDGAWSIHVRKPRGAIRSLAVEHIPLPDGVTGAESLAFDRSGRGPYAGVSDGRVLRWDGPATGWTLFAYNANYNKNPLCAAAPAQRPEPVEDAERVCGRPLGLQFYYRTGDLYIADAYMGLLKVGPDGGEAEVVAAAPVGGVPFSFTNGVDVDQATGDVYFTDSSTVYPRARNTEIMMHRDMTGRLLRYDARLRRAVVLEAGLPYPNGVAVSVDRSHVVVAHTGPCQAYRYWIRGPRAARYELLADLPGYADNVRRDGKGAYWFALNREQINATSPEHLVGVRVSGRGAELEVLTAPKGVTLSDVAEKDGELWLGSVELDYVGHVNLKS